MRGMFSNLVVALIVLLAPLSARAQTWSIDFAKGQTVLSPEGYRIAGEPAALALAEPRRWEFLVKLLPDPGEAEPRFDHADAWRLRAVLLELAERGVDITRLKTEQPGLFTATPPAREDDSREARVVIEALRVEADPLRLVHGNHVVIRFDSDATGLSPTDRFNLAIRVAGPRRQGVGALVESFADTAGTIDDNMRLSRDRADSVARELFRLGVPWDSIVIRAHGESLLARPTADGVPEPENRRVAVTLRWEQPPAR